MKVITVNLPEEYIMMMDKHIGRMHAYPSRSELIRVAVREFLIQELETYTQLPAKKRALLKLEGDPIANWGYHDPIPRDPEADLIVKVPISDTEMKIYHLVKK